MQGLSATQLSDPQEIVNAFKQAEQAELVGVREVRGGNISILYQQEGGQGGEISLFYANSGGTILNIASINHIAILPSDHHQDFIAPGEGKELGGQQ